MFSRLTTFGMITALMMGLAGSSAQAESDLIEVGIGGGDTPPILVRLNNGQLAARYRLQDGADGALLFNDLQHMVLLDVTVSFFEGKVRLDFQAGSGASFGAGWGNTGVGEHDANLDFGFRRLSITLVPKEGMEFSIGSLAPEFGAGSEDSSFDMNGYITGYRAKVTVLDGELVVTTGNINLNDPNVFDRFGDRDDINYLQVAITQAIGEIVRGTLEYSQYEGEHYARAALRFDVSKWTKFLDAITIEDMARLSSDHPGNALAVTLSKRFKDLLAGRDLSVGLSYLFRTGMTDYPLGEYAFDGHSLRVKVGVPDLIDLGNKAKFGLFVNFVQSLSDFDEFRAEVGFAIRF